MIPPPTDRLTFRDWSLADVPAFDAICSDPNVMQFVGDGTPWSLERTEQFIFRAIEMSQSLGFCQWPVIETSRSVLIGFCGFVPADDGAEVGWRLSKDCWGRGLATEAARAVITYGFETMEFSRIVATVQSANRASIRIAEKLGMTLESCFQRHGRETSLYSMTRRLSGSVTRMDSSS
jgi:RimJ/RimL family protein N-acetyltransferase